MISQIKFKTDNFWKSWIDLKKEKQKQEKKKGRHGPTHEHVRGGGGTLAVKREK